MESNERRCFACGKLLKGRADKKFCDDYCRNEFHNNRNSDRNNGVRSINNILYRNRRILESVLQNTDRSITISRSRLLEKGFDFQYYTHHYRTVDGIVYCSCYEYSYLVADDQCHLLKAGMKI